MYLRVKEKSFSCIYIKYPLLVIAKIRLSFSLDKILSDQREQQEKIAEEMIMLTKSLKEQSSIAGTIIRKDTVKLEAASAQADSNFEKLSFSISERICLFVISIRTMSATAFATITTF